MAAQNKSESRTRCAPRVVAVLLATVCALVLVAILSMPCAALAGAPQQESPNSDRLGFSCTQILQMKSTDWVAHFNEKFTSTKEKDANLTPAEKTLRAIAAYARCYDARTTRLDEQARKRGGNDLLNASIQFRNFDQSLQAFAGKALAAAQSSVDAVKIAYVALYEKQFRYDFYRSRESKNPAPAATPDQLEQLGAAKNHFGELLDDLPPEKMKDLHAAFSKIFDSSVTDATKLAVYRFAIFCLEPPSEAPFASPPF
jgi:hypothetical protein